MCLRVYFVGFFGGGGVGFCCCWNYLMPIYNSTREINAVFNFADKYYVDIDKRYVDTSDPFVKAISL